MQITKNRVVGIGYTLWDAQNQFIDAASNFDPLVYLHGYGNIIPGLEKALEGKTEGDAFNITIAADDAYGKRDEKLVGRFPRKNFEGIGTVKAGMRFAADTPEGSRMVTVTQVEGSAVTVDANHPMAGLDLIFEVTVVSVREAGPGEISQGHPHHAHGHCRHQCDGCGGCGQP
ncbi:MAG: peptidylprolyl isomerase [Spirochaetaceae bacterium]|jgi:FKBP-type peptidyl-prolyl cis-trans isomerase SlyD|nr:peptidylprolyl isomerase [Spirochaetaceae bacterium]